MSGETFSISITGDSNDSNLVLGSTSGSITENASNAANIDLTEVKTAVSGVKTDLSGVNNLVSENHTEVSKLIETSLLNSDNQMVYETNKELFELFTSRLTDASKVELQNLVDAVDDALKNDANQDAINIPIENAGTLKYVSNNALLSSESQLGSLLNVLGLPVKFVINESMLTASGDEINTGGYSYSVANATPRSKTIYSTDVDDASFLRVNAKNGSFTYDYSLAADRAQGHIGVNSVEDSSFSSYVEVNDIPSWSYQFAVSNVSTLEADVSNIRNVIRTGQGKVILDALIEDNVCAQEASIVWGLLIVLYGYVIVSQPCGPFNEIQRVAGAISQDPSMTEWYDNVSYPNNTFGVNWLDNTTFDASHVIFYGIDNNSEVRGTPGTLTHFDGTVDSSANQANYNSDWFYGANVLAQSLYGSSTKAFSFGFYGLLNMLAEDFPTLNIVNSGLYPKVYYINHYQSIAKPLTELVEYIVNKVMTDIYSVYQSSEKSHKSKLLTNAKSVKLVPGSSSNPEVLSKFVGSQPLEVSPWRISGKKTIFVRKTP